jgi:hypothetical protein
MDLGIVKVSQPYWKWFVKVLFEIQQFTSL